MIMNYVLSFCKITAASRIFSRNFYLPLLKPLTPKDALRTFKITGKWLLGSKIHHYIPVLYNHRKKRSKRAKNYGKVVHKYNDSYTYMSPVLNPDDENHKLLLNLLNTKEEEAAFVYTVEDKMYNIVMPGKYELAIRDGDIIDILVSQSNDKILIKLKNFKKIAVELQYFEVDKILYKGEGATTIEEEKFHHHGKVTMSLAKIFEAKELAEEWELEMMKIVAKKKKQKGEGTQEWNKMVSESIQNLDWQKFEVDAKKVIDQIWEPAREEHIGMEVEDLDKTRNVSEFILRQGNGLLSQLPTMAEIPDVVKSMATATFYELEEDDSKISGVKVILESGKECFIPGQMVKTEDGEIFVPGQTIENEFGVSYAPGITICMDEKPTLIKGLIMGEGESQKPMFLPTESSITPEGELTFCRSPEEKCNAMPQKIYITKKGVKKIKFNSGKKKIKKKKVELTPEVLEEEVSVKLTKEEEEANMNCKISNEIEEEEEGNIKYNPLNEVEEEYENLEVLVEEPIAIEAVICVENVDESLETNSYDELGGLDVEEYEKKIEEPIKPFDDGMEKLIECLEDKKSELQEKLEALRKLTVKLENSVTYVNIDDATKIASDITDDSEKMYKLSEIFLEITKRVNIFRERNSVNIKNVKNEHKNWENFFATEADEKFHACNEEVKTALKSCFYAANEIFKTRPKDQLLALQTTSGILRGILSENKNLEELCNLMNTKLDRHEICTTIFKELTQEITEDKTEILKSIVNDEKEYDIILEKIWKILEEDGEILNSPFKKIAKNNETLTKKVTEYVKLKIDDVNNEHEAKEALQNSIVSAIKDFTQDCLEELDDYGEEYEIKEFLLEAIALSRTLGLYEIDEKLSELSKNNEIYLLSADKSSTEFLKRFMLIKKLCEKDYSIRSSLERIKKNPECGRTDPRIRQLLLQSAALTSKYKKINTSLEIPLIFFKEQNFLAIEDCVYQKSYPNTPILISRKGIQAVVPKESARDVLSGRVPYTLIDESGVTNFKPMHMFTALKLGKNLEQRLDEITANAREKRKSPGKSKEVREVRKTLSNSRMTA